jgi:hypothetical protein
MQREGLISARDERAPAARSAAGAAGQAGPKPGDRRVRRIISWMDSYGVQRSREIILSDKAGEWDECARY